MIRIKNFVNHFVTITEHRREVRRGCFRLGLFYQGFVHDLSKYSPAEFIVGAKYYQGFRSPNNAEREDIGYSSAWLHHKGRNKHHYEYWIDYSSQGNGQYIPCRMPNKYLAEMYADRVAASKIYNKGKYTDDMPYKYFLNGAEHSQIEETTKKELEKILKMLSQKGEKETEHYIRTVILRGRIISRIVDIYEYK